MDLHELQIPLMKNLNTKKFWNNKLRANECKSDIPVSKNNAIYFFLHVPKTAGTTFIKHVKKNLKPSEYVHIEPPMLNLSEEYDNKKYKRKIEKLLLQMSENERDKVKIIISHTLPYGIHQYFNKEARYITFLRSPSSRILSIYNYLFTQWSIESNRKAIRERFNRIFFANGQVPTFDDWYERVFLGSSSDFFLMDTAEFFKAQGYKIESFHFIGTTESFDKDVMLIYHWLGFNKFFINKNVSKRQHPKLSSEQLMRISKNHKGSFSLYRRAFAKKEKFIAKNAQYDLIIDDMSMKKRVLLPFTQLIYDSPELLHVSSSYLRSKSNIYSLVIDHMKKTFLAI